MQKQPAALFFKRSTIASRIRETLANQNNKFSNKQFVLFIKYLFRSVLVWISATVNAFLVVINIIVVKNIIFTFHRQSLEVLSVTMLEGIAKDVLFK